MKKLMLSWTLVLTVAGLTFMSCGKDKDDNNNPKDPNAGTVTDARDGKTYKTIKIGNQTWFAENLQYAGPLSAGFINDPYGKADSTKKYGSLYTWEAAIIACPNGWHLPSDSEWRLLEHNLGMVDSDTGKVGYSQKRGLDQKLGTRLQKGGDLGFNFVIMDKDVEKETWTASKFSDTKNYLRNFTRNDFSVYRSSTEPGTSLCVRCLKD
ncbi:MAG: hypothetical protein J7604_26170 [Sporocytophaga sp.]|uniref:FISUMP domain-containing protein n=1 Tax=Sporocytophaga sp. TaxID=2231183 RepID=UPI001B03FC51|nr:FISUMP domain-containing protein [Sporocytophaga sp.]MBO9703719.1 hypothetical protein [Sporocytophaga sp.]